MNNLSLEVQLLLCCSRYQLTEQTAEQIRTIVSDGKLEWAKVLQLSEQQGITPLLRKHLIATVPSEKLGEWYEPVTKRSRAMRMRHMLQLAQMINLQKSLLDLGIDALYYKGPILDQMLYGGDT